MKQNQEITFTLDKAKFFEAGRILQRNWRVADLGPVSFSVRQGKLAIISKRGGTEIACEGTGEIQAELTASQFRKLIIAGRHEKSPTGTMKLVFRPEFGEVATDLAGAKALFP